jgi:hypothetical protein
MTQRILAQRGRLITDENSRWWTLGAMCFALFGRGHSARDRADRREPIQQRRRGGAGRAEREHCEERGRERQAA